MLCWKIVHSTLKHSSSFSFSLLYSNSVVCFIQRLMVQETPWPNLGGPGKILHGFMKRGLLASWGEPETLSGYNGKLKEDKPCEFFGLVFSIMGLWKFSVSIAVCG